MKRNYGSILKRRSPGWGATSASRKARRGEYARLRRAVEREISEHGAAIEYLQSVHARLCQWLEYTPTLYRPEAVVHLDAAQLEQAAKDGLEFRREIEKRTAHTVRREVLTQREGSYVRVSDQFSVEGVRNAKT